MEMSKGDFAAHIGVSAGRISQYIADGIIGPEALVGEGRNARIDVDVATSQISERRHVGQALGNGLKTRLEAGPKPPSLTGGEGELPLVKTDTAALIQLERLEQEKRKNRQAEREEAIDNGRLVDGDELARQVGRAVQTTVATFEGMVPDIANAIAAQFKLPARDVQHLVRRVMREKRAAKAGELRGEGEALPETKETVLA